ncbi:peptide-methionine (S)-S-oxide reductase MsrA [Wenzhouxiangella sp. AB-CW3]|uniref:peptide-methionine (S)-S-oxide reductase MsrA n=1 Tax=Wenzhouxiangella sp. AB-CW3 TaxID=2771012 RepID=UPI00168B5A60|nr:peptide-methionine (S)-S-oxide reductase MsrA [Wenzhouxiangella sp. AB-CW3]QOC23850.1 peptide-methionine (S)-S-oxide reductase MsrA [Wenzhouxiangella sp. AB-CW3]
MTDKATFGAGCFWGVEMRFRELDGVVDARVGYMGGSVENPTYEQVCTDRTGHAEVCEVRFDPSGISYEALVRAFFELHDPTQVNRQGPDVGRQYRSVIFTHDPDQERTAREVRDELDSAGRFGSPIATSIEPAATFWPAEDYHQQYLARRGGSCAI